MTTRWAVAALATVLLAALAAPAAAQTSDSLAPPVVRHILAIDYGRIRPFHRSYDMLVITRDSATVIGRRDVDFSEAALADSSPAWLLVETRTGLVPSTDSMLLAADLRPIQWRSTLGHATLDLAFTSDSMLGSVRMGRAASRIALAVPPDMIGSAAVAEVLLPLLPLALQWSDTANVATVDMSGATVDPTELAVVGEDSVVIDSPVVGAATVDSLAAGAVAPARQVWVMTMRSTMREAQLWVDRASGEVLRSQWPLPKSNGAMLEYRARMAPLP